MMATAICSDHASTDAVYIIDSKIKQYEKEILALKTQRNTYAPISRLPPELITRIFECCKEVESMPSRLQYQKPPRWIRCSHVCRLWRTIALDSPTLWTDLNFNHFTWIKETFVRSKMAALNVALHLIGTPDEASKVQFVKHQVICHGSRLKDLSLRSTFSAQSDLAEILGSIPRSTSNLQSLEIAYAQRSQLYAYLPGECICDADKLQHLMITGCGIDWVQHLSNKSALTVLKLHDIPSTSTISASQFLQSLAGMRSIQILELSNAFPTLALHDTGIQSRRIPLPKLRVLKLWGCSPETLGFLFKHIALGAGVYMDIVANGVDESCFTTFIEEMSSVISSNGSVIHSLRLLSATSRQLWMTAFSHDPPGVDGEADVLPRNRTAIFSLQLTISSASSDHPDMLWINTCAALPLTWVRKVSWGNSLLLSAETIISCFGALPNLHSLNFSSRYHDLIKLLQATHPSSEGTCAKFMFPVLRSLILQDFVLDDECLTDLADILIQRHEGGLEVEKLVIKQCYGVDVEEINLLSQIVADVVWDGNVLYISSDDDSSAGDYW
ncbi:hypothetical protein D9613_006731 [Agrocybe pediades]|uniref:F-box domain-containing protein n=1 Tax=Agrocybe pediades TaxID=84607 RepID=A0A8H4QHN8_9AGAR|nr:hypothetical protein D9613_006731 [Agrocybe pediades]